MSYKGTTDFTIPLILLIVFIVLQPAIFCSSDYSGNVPVKIAEVKADMLVLDAKLNECKRLLDSENKLIKRNERLEASCGEYDKVRSRKDMFFILFVMAIILLIVFAICMKNMSNRIDMFKSGERILINKINDYKKKIDKKQK